MSLEFTYTLGVEVENEFENIRIFPTLVNSLITVDFNNDNSECTIRLIDVSGKELFFQSNVSMNCIIDVSTKRDGIYFVIIEDKFGRKSTKKLMVRH